MAQPARRTVAYLTVAQAFGQIVTTMILVTTALVGNMLATDKALATLPHALGWVSLALVAIPVSQMMRRVGRRAGFMTGAAIGIVGALIAAGGIFANSFWLYAAGTIVIGAFNASNQLYRFAAAEAAEISWRSKAIAWVNLGGIVAAFVGPELAKLSKDLFAPVPFAGTFVVMAALPVLMIAVLAVTDLPPPPARASRRAGRPLVEIARQPKFVVAVLGGMIGWGVMSLMMTATPLSMIACGLKFDDAAFVIQWHVLGMYVPSFFSGALIARYGGARIMLAGAILMIGCVTAALAGVNVWNFWLANVLVGAGWNFLFVSGTAMLTETYAPEERAKVQGFNDFCVFGTVAFTAFTSGWLQNVYGWATVNYSIAPFILLVIVAILWLRARARAAAVAAE
jgi:MFS family permease